MLIVRQDGKVAMNLDNISCITLNPMSKADLVAIVPRNVAQEKFQLNQLEKDFHSFYLGNFGTERKAQAVLNALVDAYERGAKVFRINKLKLERD